MSSSNLKKHEISVEHVHRNLAPTMNSMEARLSATNQSPEERGL
jgi:hypothetical protein